MDHLGVASWWVGECIGTVTCVCCAGEGEWDDDHFDADADECLMSGPAFVVYCYVRLREVKGGDLSRKKERKNLVTCVVMCMG